MWKMWYVDRYLEKINLIIIFQRNNDELFPVVINRKEYICRQKYFHMKRDIAKKNDFTKKMQK